MTAPPTPAAGPEERPLYHEWQAMTGPQIDAIDRSRAVVMVTCSPLEVHGPHLPVVTDNLEAEALSFRTMAHMRERHPEIEFLHLPPLYVAADVLPHVGSIMFRPSTIQRVLTDLGRSLAKQGFKDIWVASFHGGPRHFVPIEVACHKVNRRHGTRMVSVFSILTGQLTGGRSDLADVLHHIEGVTRDELVGDAHGGAVETSMMLHLLGDRVDPCYRELDHTTVDRRLERRGQPPLYAGGGRPALGELMRGFKEKLKYYEEETYSGKPSIATAEIGREMIDVLAGHAAETLSRVWTRDLPAEACHSPVWKARWVFTSEWLGWAFERLLGYRSKVW